MDRLGPYLLGPNDENQGIYTGDARELAKAIPDESVDLIFTDPPYARKYEAVYSGMAEYAPRVLKPGGSLITLCGQHQVLRIGNVLSSGLRFRWSGWLLNKKKTRLSGVYVLCGGKPLLWFTKPGAKVRMSGYWWDTQDAAMWSKNNHEWEQPVDFAFWNIKTLTDDGAVIFDPFCGSGSFLISASALGRKWLAFEIDPDTAKMARKRVMQTQSPLNLPMPEQAELPL